MSDLQCHLEKYLINNVEEIVAFLELKLFISIIPKRFPAVEIYKSFCRESTIENNQFSKS